MDFRFAAGQRGGPRACGHLGRYVMAAADPGHLDTEQTAVDHTPRGG